MRTYVRITSSFWSVVGGACILHMDMLNDQLCCDSRMLLFVNVGSVVIGLLSDFFLARALVTCSSLILSVPTVGTYCLWCMAVFHWLVLGDVVTLYMYIRMCHFLLAVYVQNIWRNVPRHSYW